MRTLALAPWLLAAFLPGIASAQPAEVSITGQWIRALGPGAPAAGYFILRNDTDHTVSLIGAASPACGSLTLHRTVRQHTMSAMTALDPDNPAPMGRMSMMQPIASVPVPGNGSVQFGPGGYHLMCEQPSDAVRAGQRIAVTLQLEGHASLTSAFPVKDARGR